MRRQRRPRRAIGALLLAAAVLAVGAASQAALAAAKPRVRAASNLTPSYPTPPARPPLGRVIHVPADAPTIQAGVDSAQPGDMVLVARGVYREAVRVTTAGITIRGQDRAGVILDGAFTRAGQDGIAVLTVDGVAIENMTARNYHRSGFYWRGVYGFRGSFLTASNNGGDGLYAFDSSFGMFDHDYAGGQSGSGFRIDQCHPCNALITGVVATGNTLGYSGANAGGNLVIRDSQWSENMAGIVVGTADSEARAPESGVVIVGNWVHANHSRHSPPGPDRFRALGNGIALAGGSDNEVAYNLVDDHPYAGIAVSPAFDKRLWVGSGNRVHDNAVGGSGLADLALAAPAGKGNCFTGNHFRSSIPPAIQEAYGCDSPLAAIGGGDIGLSSLAIGAGLRSTLGFPGGDRRSAPAVPELEGMPDVSVAPATPGLYSPLDPAADVAADRAGAEAGNGGPAAPVMAAFPRATAPGRSGEPGNLFFLLAGYGLPVLLIAGVASRILSRDQVEPRRGLSRTRTLVALPVAYVAFSLVAVALGYLGVGP